MCLLCADKSVGGGVSQQLLCPLALPCKPDAYSGWSAACGGVLPPRCHDVPAPHFPGHGTPSYLHIFRGSGPLRTLKAYMGTGRL
jgi:hypothetical protein